MALNVFRNRSDEDDATDGAASPQPAIDAQNSNGDDDTGPKSRHTVKWEDNQGVQLTVSQE